MPQRIDDHQLDLVDEIQKVADDDATGHLEYDMSEELMLQTGDRIKWLEEGIWDEGYFDGTVRWNVDRQCWMLQVRTGETDATDLIYPDRLILLNQRR